MDMYERAFQAKGRASAKIQKHRVAKLPNSMYSIHRAKQQCEGHLLGLCSEWAQNEAERVSGWSRAREGERMVMSQRSNCSQVWGGVILLILLIDSLL